MIKTTSGTCAESVLANFDHIEWTAVKFMHDAVIYSDVDSIFSAEESINQSGLLKSVKHHYGIKDTDSVTLPNNQAVLYSLLIARCLKLDRPPATINLGYSKTTDKFIVSYCNVVSRIQDRSPDILTKQYKHLISTIVSELQMAYYLEKDQEDLLPCFDLITVPSMFFNYIVIDAGKLSSIKDLEFVSKMETPPPTKQEIDKQNADKKKIAAKKAAAEKVTVSAKLKKELTQLLKDNSEEYKISFAISDKIHKITEIKIELIKENKDSGSHLDALIKEFSSTFVAGPGLNFKITYNATANSYIYRQWKIGSHLPFKWHYVKENNQHFIEVNDNRIEFDPSKHEITVANDRAYFYPYSKQNEDSYCFGFEKNGNVLTDKSEQGSFIAGSANQFSQWLKEMIK